VEKLFFDNQLSFFSNLYPVSSEKFIIRTLDIVPNAVSIMIILNKNHKIKLSHLNYDCFSIHPVSLT